MNVVVLIFLFVGLTLTSCSINTRQTTILIIQDVERFRDAQRIYKDKYGNGYASVNELIEKGLLETRFGDLEENGFRFNLTVEKEHYNLSVVPIAEENKSHSEDDELSLFVDDSGVIRASIKPNIAATSNSQPISPK